MSRYTPDYLLELGCDGMGTDLLERTRLALEGFDSRFGPEWFNREVIGSIYDTPSTGRCTIYVGETSLLPLVSLWEDWLLVESVKGADELLRRLRQGPRFEDVDVEVSVAAAVARSGARVEFDPTLPDGRHADLRLQVNREEWTWVEVTRRSQSPSFRAENAELAKSAGLAATRIAVGAHGTIVLLDQLEYHRVLRWVQGLNTLPEGCTRATLDCAAIFFLSPPGGYDPAPGLEILSGRPHMYMVQAAEFPHCFGTMWAYRPDFDGCKNKILQKRKQLPTEMAGVIVVDVSGVSGAISDWATTIDDELFVLEDCANIGAVVLANSLGSSQPFAFSHREIVAIENRSSLRTPLPFAQIRDIFARLAR